jgi:hypothetical protein
MMKASGLAFLAALAVSAAAWPAAGAENLSGVYEGKLSCRTLDGGVSGKQKEDFSLGIYDDGSGALDAYSLQLPPMFYGFAVGDAAKPQRAVLSFVQCGLDQTQLSGAAIHAEARAKAGSSKATISGTVIRMQHSANEAALCRFRVKRIDPNPPPMPLCI